MLRCSPARVLTSRTIELFSAPMKNNEPPCSLRYRTNQITLTLRDPSLREDFLRRFALRQRRDSYISTCNNFQDSLAHRIRESAPARFRRFQYCFASIYTNGKPRMLVLTWGFCMDDFDHVRSLKAAVYITWSFQDLRPDSAARKTYLCRHSRPSRSLGYGKCRR